MSIKTKLLYIACPYSDPDPNVREERFRAVNYYAAVLMQRGFHVFSPISHTHPIALAGNLPKGWEFWKAYDEKMLSVCDELLVFQLPGWSTSVGVTEEILIAQRLGLPIEYITP